jgi:hypothetical protein
MASPAKEKVLAQGSKIDPSWVKYTPGYQPSIMKGDTPSKPTTALDVAEILLGFAPTPANAVTKLAKAMVPAAVVGAATYSPDSEATIVTAAKRLKGMRGVHPNYDVDEFLKAEALLGEYKNTANLERKFGIFRTPEGLKTNISDRGMGMRENAVDDLLQGKELTFDEAIFHPNKDTIIEATRDKNLFANMTVKNDPNYRSLGGYNPNEDSIKLNIHRIAADELKRGSSAVTLDRAVGYTLGHEGLGHGVQARLGVQGGANQYKALAHPKFAEMINERVLSQPNPEIAAEALLSTRMPRAKIGALTKEQKAQAVSDLIAEQVYLKHAGEQTAEAPMKLLRTQDTIGTPDDQWDTVLDQFLFPVKDQIYK